MGLHPIPRPWEKEYMRGSALRSPRGLFSPKVPETRKNRTEQVFDCQIKIVNKAAVGSLVLCLAGTVLSLSDEIQKLKACSFKITVAKQSKSSSSLELDLCVCLGCRHERSSFGYKKAMTESFLSPHCFFVIFILIAEFFDAALIPIALIGKVYDLQPVFQGIFHGINAPPARVFAICNANA